MEILRNLPKELRSLVIYNYFPRNSCAQLLFKQKKIYLKYVRNFIFDENGREHVWEHLRPSKLNKINYGGGPSFLIIRNKLSKGELIRMRALTNDRETPLLFIEDAELINV